VTDEELLGQFVDIYRKSSTENRKTISAFLQGMELQRMLDRREDEHGEEVLPDGNHHRNSKSSKG